MHELSIANNVVQIAEEHARRGAAERVTEVTLRIGVLSCVHPSALQFSFEAVTQGTLLEGARLTIIDVPLVAFCESCEEEVELPSIHSFRCPQCDSPTADIRHGKELEIESIEIV